MSNEQMIRQQHVHICLMQYYLSVHSDANMLCNTEHHLSLICLKGPAEKSRLEMNVFYNISAKTFLNFHKDDCSCKYQAGKFVTIEEARDMFPNGSARRSVLGGMVMEEDLSLRIMTRLLVYYN